MLNIFKYKTAFFAGDPSISQDFDPPSASKSPCPCRDSAKPAGCPKKPAGEGRYHSVIKSGWLRRHQL